VEVIVMSGHQTASPPDRQRSAKPGGAAVVRSWVSLAFYPLSFVSAFVLGEGLLSWYGYADGQGVPLWAAIAAAAPALLLFSLPGICAVLFGRQAVRLGNPGGQLPSTIGAVIALGVIALNVLSGIATVLT
jgi:hypothetical protein